MAQYDLLLKQNVHATLVEYTERFVNIGKGALLSANSSSVPTVLAAGTDGYYLKRDDAEATGLKWVTAPGGCALSGSTNNTICTVTGANAIQGEANLTFDGSILAVTGTITATSLTVPVSTGKFIFGDADSYFYEISDDLLRLCLGGTDRFIWGTTYFCGVNANAGGVLNEACSATNPTLCPDRADTALGIGGSGSSDYLSLIVNSIEYIRLTATEATITGNFYFATGANRTVKIADGTSTVYSLYILGQYGTTAANAGAINVTGGESTTYIGGTVNVTGGYGNTTGGAVNITGGIAGIGGGVTITGGLGNVTTGGNVNINGGNGATVDGSIILGTSNTVAVQIDTTTKLSTLTTQYAIVFLSDTSGTLAIDSALLYDTSTDTLKNTLSKTTGDVTISVINTNTASGTGRAAFSAGCTSSGSLYMLAYGDNYSGSNLYGYAMANSCAVITGTSTADYLMIANNSATGEILFCTGLAASVTAERMSIAANGSVSILAESDAPLIVSGTADSSSVFGWMGLDLTASNTLSDGDGVGINFGGGGAEMLGFVTFVKDTASASYGKFLVQTAKGSLNTPEVDSDLIIDSAGDVWLGYSGNTPLVTIYEYVGIGIAASSSYSLRVDGNIYVGTYLGVGVAPSSSYAIYGYKSGTSQYAALFQNAGAASTAWGINIRAGSTSYACARWINFDDSDGTQTGWISSTNSTDIAIVAASDIRLKTNISIYKADALQLLAQIPINTFEFIKQAGLEGHKPRVGYIAQYVEPMFPDMVEYDEISDVYGVKKQTLIPIMHKGINQLYDQTKDHESRIKVLEDELRALKSTIVT
jgi:hypothetical protein